LKRFNQTACGGTCTASVKQQQGSSVADLADRSGSFSETSRKNASPDVASAIAAQALMYFDDPRAQSAADQYLSKEAAQNAREEKAKGIGPFGSWPP
jgi:hypothetical protein